jgi:3-dehydroquinate dehydratase-2
MLGVREPDIYGRKTLGEIALECEEFASELGFDIDFRQSNSEGEMVTIIQQAREGCDGVVINAAAYAHTSVALHDALKMLDVPVVEVHLTNTHKREPFRQTSYVSMVAQGVICGFGSHGYLLALNALRAMMEDE